MGFEARGDTIKGLLSSTRQYRIPRFQREFSWDETNYKEFYLDLLKQITWKNNMFETNQYYLGNMLFLGNKEASVVDVIDGQQRLTTSTIFLAALRDVLSKLDDPQAKSYAATIQKEYIAREFDGEITRKLETKSSFPYFSQTIQGIDPNKLIQEPKSEEEISINKTYEYFKIRFNKNTLSMDIKYNTSLVFNTDNYVDLLKTIRDQLLNSEIIAVFITNKTQANQIFENINSKGKPLSAVDLIKNSIFSKIPVSATSGIDDLAERWSSITQQVSESHESTSFNEFFLHYWKANYPEDSANGSNLYKKYTKRFEKEDEESIAELVLDLERNLELYLMISDVTPNSFKKQEKKEEYEYLTALKNFGAVQVRVPILALYNSKIKRISKIRVEILKFLSFFNFIAYGTSVKFNGSLTQTPYKKFTQNINTAENRQEVLDSFSELKNDLIDLFNKDEVLLAFTKLKYDKKNARSSLSEFSTIFILKEMAKKMDNVNYCDSYYSIEHIIDESTDKACKSIGNLLVLERKINDELSQRKNTATIVNKNSYYNKSRYEMVKEFVEEYPSFKIDDIELRSQKLFYYFWNNLWSPFMEIPILLRGTWVSGDIEITLTKDSITQNRTSYSITSYSKSENTYTLLWDTDKVSFKGNPQPFIYEYLPETDELLAGIIYQRKKI